MKFFFKFLFIILIILLIIGSISISIGYSIYLEAIAEKDLETRVNEVTSKENYVSYSDLSTDYINAVIDTENSRFYEHGPIDILGLLRAMFVNISTLEFSQGGSTITQQVSKNLIFSQEQTLTRKLGELIGAFKLEETYTKDEIFALYVNTAYFGDGYYGIYDASYGYYNKHPKDLTLDEASMLAGVPNAPSLYAPTINIDLAKERQQQVLSRMVECGSITQEEADLVPK